MRMYGWVALGGGIGTLLRFGISTLFLHAYGYHTVVINIVGSLLLALLFTLLPGHHESNRGLRLMLGTGMLGGFTTMSTFSLDVAKLLVAHQVGAAVLVLGTSILGGLTAAACGVWIGKSIRGEQI